MRACLLTAASTSSSYGCVNHQVAVAGSRVKPRLHGARGRSAVSRQAMADQVCGQRGYGVVVVSFAVQLMLLARPRDSSFVQSRCDGGGRRRCCCCCDCSAHKTHSESLTLHPRPPPPEQSPLQPERTCRARRHPRRRPRRHRRQQRNRSVSGRSTFLLCPPSCSAPICYAPLQPHAVSAHSRRLSRVSSNPPEPPLAAAVCRGRRRRLGGRRCADEHVWRQRPGRQPAGARRTGVGR
jgi:hypothetical protein